MLTNKLNSFYLKLKEMAHKNQPPSLSESNYICNITVSLQISPLLHK